MTILEAIELSQTTEDDVGSFPFGKCVYIRQYGNGPHYELLSDAPGNDGLESVIILQEDFEKVGKMFLKLAGKGDDDEIQDSTGSEGDDSSRKGGAKGKGSQPSQ